MQTLPQCNVRAFLFPATQHLRGDKKVFCQYLDFSGGRKGNSPILEKKKLRDLFSSRVESWLGLGAKAKANFSITGKLKFM